MPEDESPPPDDLCADPRAWATARVDAIIDAAADQSRPLGLEVKPPPQTERRQEPRFSLEEPAMVEVSTWAEMLELYTKDISRNGIFIQTDSPPPPGTEVGVHLLLPDGAGTIRFQGRVAHIVTRQSGPRPGFGVRFYDIGQEARNTLHWIVAQAKSATKAASSGDAARRRSAGVEAAARRRSQAEAEQEERRRLRSVLCEVGARSDLDVLGLHDSPSIEQIDQAFDRVGWQWDPKRQTGASPEVLRLYKSIHFRIECAYRRLRAGQSTSTEAFAAALSNLELGDLE